MLAAALFVASASASVHRATTDGKAVSWHVHRAKALFDSAYEPEKGHPDRQAIEAAQGHRRAIRIQKVRRELGEFRAKVKAKWEAARFAASVTPFEGPDGRHYAIPYEVVYCETGVRNVSPYGYYALVDWDNPTWGAHAFAPTAYQATFEQQSIVAHRMYAMFGLGPWEASRSCWGS